MNKLMLVIRREYVSRITKRSFILTTLLVPLLIILFPVFIFWMAGKNANERVAVVDETALFEGKLTGNKRIEFIFENRPLDSLKMQYKQLHYDGILVITGSDSGLVGSIKYFSEKSLNFTNHYFVQAEVSKELERLRLVKAGLPSDFIDGIKRDVTIESVLLSEKGEQSDTRLVGFITAFIMGLIMYVTLIVYGVMVMNGVVEEKTNRILEVVVSSVKPFQMLMGKILGVAAVGLTQLLAWFTITAILFNVGMFLFGGTLESFQTSTLSGSGMKTEDAQAAAIFLKSVNQIDLPQVIVGFLFYFLGGYLFYASLYAAAASGANDASDVQSLSFPVSMPIILAFFVMQVAVNDPGGSTAFWGSMIPFTSPIVMLARLPAGVPWWEMLLSMACLVAGFVATTWMASKIYRVGILMYGKKTSIKELVKWIGYRG
ncbi:MAG: ABC transporter permease [Bacteroidetes bacterium]|nr:ABC transporter permease [Bacteroidota bacterium]